MGNRKLSDWGVDAGRFLMSNLKSGYIIAPHMISMAKIAEEIGTTPQNVGMSFPHIKRILNLQGYEVRCVGRSPRSIQIENNRTSPFETST